MPVGSTTRVVDTYVYYLRRKLKDSERRLIRTVRGVGYVLELVPASSSGAVVNGRTRSGVSE